MRMGTPERQLILRGIVSWGSGCGSRFKPGVYTDVAQLPSLDWSTPLRDGPATVFPFSAVLECPAGTWIGRIVFYSPSAASQGPGMA